MSIFLDTYSCVHQFQRFSFLFDHHSIKTLRTIHDPQSKPPKKSCQEDFDEKVDIYAFSLILYYIFSGRQSLGWWLTVVTVGETVRKRLGGQSWQLVIHQGVREKKHETGREGDMGRGAKRPLLRGL